MCPVGKHKFFYISDSVKLTQQWPVWSSAQDESVSSAQCTERIRGTVQ